MLIILKTTKKPSGIRTMLACFVWLIIATIFIQVPNLLGIQSQQEDGILKVMDAVKIAAITLPVTFTATTGFTLYYGRGDQYFSYSSMVIYAHVVALAVGILIQVYLLKSRETNPVELLGLGLGLLGIFIAIYSKDILKYFSS